MPERPTKVLEIAGRSLSLRPLGLGAFKRQHAALVTLNTMQRGTAQLPEPAQIDAMISVIAESASLTADEKAAWVKALEDGDFVQGVVALSEGILSVFDLTGMKKAEGEGGVTSPGEAPSSSSVTL